MNPTLREQLEYAEKSCGCESYYQYQCHKCGLAADGKAPNVVVAVESGYVTWKGYGSPNLTDRGHEELKRLRNERVR